MPWTEWAAIAEGQKTESRNCPECCLSNRPNLDFIMKLTLNFWRLKYIPFASLDLLIFTTCRYKNIFFFLVMFRRVVFCLKMAGIQKSLAKGGKAICYQMKKVSVEIFIVASFLMSLSPFQKRCYVPVLIWNSFFDL